jgi:hypothetical protein
MKNLLVLASISALLIAAQCRTASPPSPVPTPTPLPVVDAGPLPMGGSAPVLDASPEPAIDPGVRLACDKLAALGCPEGRAGCTTVLQHAVTAHPTSVPLACMVAAQDKAAMRACGSFVSCQ